MLCKYYCENCDYVHVEEFPGWEEYMLGSYIEVECDQGGGETMAKLEKATEKELEKYKSLLALREEVLEKLQNI